MEKARDRSRAALKPSAWQPSKLALELGNDINAHADFGDFPIEGDGTYLLLYYPANIDRLPPNALGDVRWTGSTALHGAIISNQLSIVKFLVEHGAQVDARNKLGWTPLMVAEGVFVTNTRHEYPEAAAWLKSLQ
jgi:ankyrin repeat protein